MSKLLIELVQNKFSDAVSASYSQHGDETIVVRAGSWLSVGQYLRDDPACDMALLVDLTAVDFPDQNPRFEVVAHLASIDTRASTAGESENWSTRCESRRDRFLEWPLGLRQLGRARMLRYVWHHFQGASGLEKDIALPRIRRTSLAQRLPRTEDSTLIPFREVDNIDKLPPFGPTEGMSFGRQTHNQCKS